MIFGFLIRRFRWVFVGALGRWAARRVTDASVQAATKELAQKLPDPVVKAADALPGDVMRAGGATLVAGRVAARGIGSVGARARGRAKGQVRDIRDEIVVESELAERSLWSDFLRFTGRVDEATDALLDLRSTNVDPNQKPGEAFIGVPRPVGIGRRFGTRRRPELVNRKQRSYRRQPKAWD